jgi:transcriptional regulator with XRE-family HTH domain
MMKEQWSMEDGRATAQQATQAPPGLGLRVRRARMWRGWRQADLARAIGVSANALSQIERGTVQNPSSGLVRAIAVTLGVPTDFLLGLSEALDAHP